MESCDVLAIAPHPDDAEIFAGGTLLKLRRAGHRIGIVDLTRGESGTRGTMEERIQEARAATGKLDLVLRENLALPDCAVVDSIENRQRLAALIRATGPSLLLGPDDSDYHPDHVAASRLTAAAFFLAGVGGAPIPGKPHRPRRFLRFLGNLPRTPQLIVDIGDVWEEKVALVRCYASQLRPTSEGDHGQHFLQGADILGRMQARAVHFGLLGGVQYGEPFVGDRPLLLEGLPVE